MKTYICTSGTSIANKKIDIEDFKNLPFSKYAEREKEFQHHKKIIVEKFEDLDIVKDYNDFSAEIKSLVKMGINKADKVILISSDTLDGKLCAECIKDVLENRIGCSVEIKVIDGLQANDGKAFTRKGLKELFNYLMKYNKPYEDIIFNLTGGYKSVVPYIAIIGMLFNKPIKYIHEDSEDIISLTGIPLVQDDDLFFKIENKLREIEKEGSISREDWQKGIDYYDSRYDCLIEEDNGEVTLSGIGEIFWIKFKSDYPEDIPKDFTPPSEKPNKLKEHGIRHHGIEKILPLSERLLESRYVKGIISSYNNQPKANKYIRSLRNEDVGICLVTNVKTDEGFSFLIKTTARNNEENEKIADLLNKKYFK